jgi:hypothetical protein
MLRRPPIAFGVAAAGVAVALALSALVTAGCGYGLAGRGATLPPHVRTIAVGPFTNQTTVPELDRILADAVQKELASRGKWKVVPAGGGADVDAVVSGSIGSLVPAPKALNESRQVSRVEITVTASVEFKDLRDNGKVLWSSPSHISRDEYDVTSAAATTDASAFLRQNQDALTRLAARFARTVVSSMLEGM